MENRQYEEEISLKELIMALLNNWKIIVASVIVAAILALGYVVLIADEVYEATMEGTINIPGSVSTRYGGYSFPTSNKMDYLNSVYDANLIQKTIDDLNLDPELVSLQGFRETITIESEEGSTRFSFTITGESPEDARHRLDVLINNYEDEMRTLYKEAALISFIRDYGVSAKNLQENLEQTQRQLTEIQEEFEDIEPVITLRKLVTSDPVYAAELAQNRGVRIEELSEEMMLEEVINPHYNSLQGTLIDLRKEIQNIERAIDKNNKFTDELKNELSNIRTYIQTQDASNLDPEMVNVMETVLRFGISPDVPNNPIAPRKMLIMAISIVLGGMLGVFAAFFKEYWQKAN